MAAYRYGEPAINPYGATVGELLLHGNDALARAAEIGGQARADAALRRGNAWARGVEQVAQIPGQIIADNRQKRIDADTAKLRAAQIAETQAQAEDRRLQTATRQRAALGMDLLGKLTKQYTAADDFGVKTVDHDAIAQGLTEAGFGDEAQKYLHGASETAADREKLAAAKRATNAAIASAIGNAAHKATDAGDFLARIDHFAMTDDVPPDVRQKFVDEVTQGGPEGWDALKKRYVDWADRVGKPIELKADTSLVAPVSGTPIVQGPKSRKTESELAADAADPASPTRAQSIDALERIKKNRERKPAPGSLQEQLLEAITAGDETKRINILGTMRAAAAATKDPTATALVNELAQLRKSEADERLKKLREDNAPIDIKAQTFTTMSGRQYVDLSEYQTPTAKERARKAAEAAGIPTVNKDQADGLRAADTARANLTAMLAQIKPYLAKDAAGRIITGPKNKLEKIFQSNPVLGAIGSWRTSAIQTVQALAEKGMGLRLNRSEIDLMLENDIPQPTDSFETAQQRINNLFTMLDTKERDAIERDRRPKTPLPAAAAPPPKTPSTPGLDALRNR